MLCLVAAVVVLLARETLGGRPRGQRRHLREERRRQEKPRVLVSESARNHSAWLKMQKALAMSYTEESVPLFEKEITEGCRDAGPLHRITQAFMISLETEERLADITAKCPQSVCGGPIDVIHGADPT